MFACHPFQFPQIIPEFLTVVIFLYRRVGKFVKEYVHNFIGTPVNAYPYLGSLICIITQESALHSVVS